VAWSQSWWNVHVLIPVYCWELVLGLELQQNIAHTWKHLQSQNLKVRISLHRNSASELRDVTCHMGSATRHKWMHPALLACTRFTYPAGMEGWVTQQCTGRKSNPRSLDHKSDALTTTPPRCVLASTIQEFNLTTSHQAIRSNNLKTKLRFNCILIYWRQATLIYYSYHPPATIISKFTFEDQPKLK